MGRRVTLLVAAAGLQPVAWLLLLVLLTGGHLGYSMHEMSDSLVYIGYAAEMVHGRWPYADFPVEYPPLALLLFWLPPSGGSLASYELWFSVEMIVCSLAAAVASTAVALAVWDDEERALGVAAVFALGLLALGGITINRYDAAVALAIAVTLLAAMGGRWRLTGMALGAGFALKLTPAVLLPVALFASGRRRWSAVVGWFVVTAVGPFLPFLARGGQGLAYLATFHVGRPLQIESVLATPLLVGRALGVLTAGVEGSRGSQNLAAAGSGTLAALSPLLMLGGLAWFYWYLWRWRTHVEHDRGLIAPVFLAATLLVVCTSKVLSPQYLVWMLPMVAVTAVGERGGGRWAALLVLVAMALTQVEFPHYYWRVVGFEIGPVLLVAARNSVLVVAAVLAVRHVLRRVAGADAALQTAPVVPLAPSREDH